MATTQTERKHNAADRWAAWTDKDRWTITDPAKALSATPAPTAAKDKPRGTCGLTLRINGERDTVRLIPARDFGARKAWRLRKLASDRVTYDVIGLVTGPECSCPDFVWRRDGIDPAGCKHCRALKALGLLD